MFHGLSVKAARQLAYNYAKRNNKVYPAPWDKNNESEIDWFYGLMSRHNNLRIRMPETTSIARAVAFNRFNVMVFFDNFEEILSRGGVKFDPNRLYVEPGRDWNSDCPICYTYSTEKGAKQVGLLTSTEKGNLVTICACVNAAGNALPPAYIFPRVHFKDHMLNGAPNGSRGFATSSGWMNRELFPQVLRHFLNLMNVSKDNPGILVMDNHDSHTTLEVIDVARENGLIILTFPPHCIHRMQPLDVSVFGPFKAYYNRACTDHLLSNQGKSLTAYDLASISSTAFYKAFTIENVQAEFRKCGIFPMNRNVFSEDAFLSSKPFDRPQLQDNEQQPGPSKVQDARIVVPTVVPDPTPSPNATDQTLKNFGIVSPQEIRPFPSAAPRDQTTKKRASKKSAIITDTPERLQVLEKQKSVMKPKKTAARRKLIESSESEEEQSGKEHDTDSEIE
ncbi:tigger transposable element-derived protein [Plakobranchus ocellatus]|uniref:Tigger transposable element-derived protein n=1 Tax=Plakobranchus ocellatus TaxID=259542 RepID=A0AAV3YGA3_9GAST|nr:tigger transposable element-derived protein [Plakobranchus ocellatus]